MISARKLIKMARKWQRTAALRRKSISFPKKMDEASTSDHSSEVAEKRHFIVYTIDRVRFSFPIAYLGNLVFRELLRMSAQRRANHIGVRFTVLEISDFFDAEEGGERCGESSVVVHGGV